LFFFFDAKERERDTRVCVRAKSAIKMDSDEWAIHDEEKWRKKRKRGGGANTWIQANCRYKYEHEQQTIVDEKTMLSG